MATLEPVLAKLRDYYKPKIRKASELKIELIENNIDPTRYFDTNKGEYINYVELVDRLSREWHDERKKIIDNAKKLAKEKGVVIMPEIEFPRPGRGCWGIPGVNDRININF